MVTECCLCAESNGIRVTRLGAGRSGVRISAKCKRFFSRPKRPDRLGVASSLLLNWYPVCYPGIKRPGREVNHSRPSSAKVKNKGVYLFFPFVFMRWTGKTLPFSRKEV